MQGIDYEKATKVRNSVNIPWDEYVKYAEKDGPGDHLVLTALANSLEIKICVLSAKNKFYIFEPQGVAKDTIVIAHWHTTSFGVVDFGIDINSKNSYDELKKRKDALLIGAMEHINNRRKTEEWVLQACSKDHIPLQEYKLSSHMGVQFNFNTRIPVISYHIFNVDFLSLPK